MNLFQIASRVALPMTRFLEKTSETSNFVPNPEREAQYREFFKYLDLDVQVLSFVGTSNFDEREIEPFLEPGVVTIVEGALGGGDRDPAWLVHDALGHSSGSEQYWMEGKKANRKLSRAFGQDFYQPDLVSGKALLADPTRAVVEVLPDRVFPRKSVENSDKFAEFAVRYVKENGKPLRFDRLPNRRFFVDSGESDLVDLGGKEGIVITRYEKGVENVPVVRPVDGLPNVTRAINELIDFVYERIRTHLESHKGGYITDQTVYAADFPGLLDEDLEEEEAQ